MFTSLSLSVEIGLLIAIIASIILMYFEKKLSIFRTILLFIFSLLLSESIFSLGNDIYKVAFYPTYEATITHVDNYLEHDEGGEYLMYKPTYTFNDGQKDINIKSPILTRRELIVGDTVKIAYQNGKFLECGINIFLVVIPKVCGAILSFFILFIIMGTVLTKISSIIEYYSLIDNMIILYFLLSFLILLSFEFIYRYERILNVF